MWNVRIPSLGAKIPYAPGPEKQQQQQQQNMKQKQYFSKFSKDF